MHQLSYGPQNNYVLVWMRYSDQMCVCASDYRVHQAMLPGHGWKPTYRVSDTCRTPRGVSGKKENRE